MKTKIKQNNKDMESKCKFGSINNITGETRDGFIDKNGQMKYKKSPWYKRIFQKLPIETKYLGVVELTSQFIWSNQKRPFNAPYYKDFNPFTNEIIEVYSIVNGHKYNFNLDCFLDSGRLIM